MNDTRTRCLTLRAPAIEHFAELETVVVPMGEAFPSIGEWDAMNGCLSAVVPPTGVPQALKQRRWVSVDEMNVAADGLVEECENPAPEMGGGHRFEKISEIMDQVEDHAWRVQALEQRLIYGRKCRDQVFRSRMGA